MVTVAASAFGVKNLNSLGGTPRFLALSYTIVYYTTHKFDPTLEKLRLIGSEALRVILTILSNLPLNRFNGEYSN